MSILLKTHKMLWGRAANRCSFKNCRLELIIDATKASDESIVGDACHIVSEKPSGPRAKNSISREYLDEYGNLILLCKIHHKLVDDQEDTYTIENLQEMKATHETWVRESLSGFDAEKQRDDELYAAYVDEWVKRADLDGWLDWSSWVLGPIPRMRVKQNEELENLRTWVFTRIWPKRYLELEAAFENFRHVLQDFQMTFLEHAKEIGSEEAWLTTDQFYRIDEWNPSLYQELSNQFDYHVDFVQDLFLELTRAANYICDHARKSLNPGFRLSEGIVIVESGPYIDLNFKRQRPEYRGAERVSMPYPGIEKFKKIRESRDLHFGKGNNANDSDFRASGGL